MLDEGWVRLCPDVPRKDRESEGKTERSLRKVDISLAIHSRSKPLTYDLQKPKPVSVRLEERLLREGVFIWK